MHKPNYNSNFTKNKIYFISKLRINGEISKCRESLKNGKFLIISQFG